MRRVLTIVCALCALCVLASTAMAAPVHVEFIPSGSGSHDAEILLTALEPTTIAGVQLALLWEPAGSEILYEPTEPNSLGGFPLSGAAGNPNNDGVSDGDAMLVWLCSWPAPVVDVDGFSIGTISFDKGQHWRHQLDLVASIPKWIIPTKIAEIGGANVWDGQTSSIVLPEPSSLLLLACGYGLIRRPGRGSA